MISFIIVNYKSANYLEQCLNSIFKIVSSTPYEIIIVNNSPEENLNKFKKGKPKIIIIESKNIGYSSGCNIGAKNSHGEYLFFINPDTILLNDFFSDLFQYFKNLEYGAIGFKLLDRNKQFQISFGKFPSIVGEIKNKSIKNAFRKRNQKIITKLESKYINPSPVDWVSGAAFFIKKATFEMVGGFDERFFLYYEDADLCMRISKSGFPNYFFPPGNIIHFEAENIRTEFSYIYIHAKKSQLLYYKLHNGIFQTILLRIYLSLKFGIKFLLSFKKTYLTLFLLAIGLKND